MSIKAKLVKELTNSTERGFSRSGKSPVAIKHGFDIKPSILFHSIVDYSSDDKMVPDYNHLPFDDMMILIDISVNVGPGELSKEDQELKDDAEKHQVLVRLLKLDDKVYLLEYIRDLIRSRLHLMTVGLLDVDEQRFKRIDGVVQEDGFVQQTYNQIGDLLATIQTYERVVADTTPGKFKLSKMKPVERGRCIEYTLDLAKPIARPNSPSGIKGTPKCEHDRRGHWRTYKSGKTVWIKGGTIAKGSKRGRIEKAYTKSA